MDRAHGRRSICGLYALPACPDEPASNAEFGSQRLDWIWRWIDGDAGGASTIWCDMHGFSKNQQRGLVQPFIAAMQICALALLLSSHNISSHVLVDLAISVPALVAGTALGIVLFNRVDQLAFRRIVLIILLFSGLSLGV